MSVRARAQAEVAKLKNNAITKAQARLDSWQNTLIGLGGIGDKARQREITLDPPMDPWLAEALYTSDDMAATIVNALPEYGLREGFRVMSPDDDRDKVAQVQDVLTSLGTCEKVLESATWGRLYGGGLLVLGSAAQDLSTPAPETAPLDYLLSLGRTEVTVATLFSNPTKPNYGLPESYRITSSLDGQSYVLHESRVVRFPGVLTPRDRKRQNQGWDDSALQKVYEILADTAQGWNGLIHLMTDLSQAVYKLHGLLEQIAEGDVSQVNTRMALVDAARSIARALIVDAEHESFEYVPRNVQGVDTLIQQIWLRLSAAARMPVSILMGQSPTGLNATGQGETRAWYDQVRAYQTHVLKPALDRVLKAVLVGLEIDPTGWSVEFPSLYQLTDLEKAQLRNTVAQTDGIYVDKGVTLPEEIALSRWGRGEYSAETQIDTDAREKILAAELAAQVEPADDSVQATALNGAQASAAMEIVGVVARGELPRETGVRLLMLSFPSQLDEKSADELIGEAGTPAFKPTAPEPKPGFGVPNAAPDPSATAETQPESPAQGAPGDGSETP